MRAVLFDLDDTLIVERADVIATVERFWAALGRRACGSEAPRAFWCVAEERWAALDALEAA